MCNVFNSWTKALFGYLLTFRFDYCQPVRPNPSTVPLQHLYLIASVSRATCKDMRISYLYQKEKNHRPNMPIFISTSHISVSRAIKYLPLQLEHSNILIKKSHLSTSWPLPPTPEPPRFSPLCYHFHVAGRPTAMCVLKSALLSRPTFNTHSELKRGHYMSI